MYRPTRTPEENARVQAMVDRLVAEAPPPTPELASRLAALLRPSESRRRHGCTGGDAA